MAVIASLRRCAAASSCMLASVADIGRYLERDTPAVGPGLQSPLLRDNGRDHVIMGVTMGVIPVYGRT